MSAASAPSAPQLVFEGPDPERLLLEAWSVHGTQVRISEPVVVRRGGVAGFFAKAHYRIEVVPSSPAEAGGAGPAAGAAGALRRPTRVEEATETVVTSPYAATRPPSPTTPPQVTPSRPSPTRTAPPRVIPSRPISPRQTPPRVIPSSPAAIAAPARAEGLADGRAPAATSPTAQALEELVEATEDEVNLATSRRATFDEVLDKVASSLGEEPAAVAAQLPADPSHAAPPPPAAPEAVATPEAPAEPEVSVAPEAQPATDAVAALEAQPAAVAPAGPETEAAPTPQPADVATTARDALREQLELVGFPEVLLTDAASAPRSLLEAFALAPAPRALPTTPGSLIAVVGSVGVAKGIAAQLGIPTAEVARARRARTLGEAASQRLVHDEREAADLAPGWRRDRIGVVAVSVSSLARDGAWARSMLRALAPSMTIALASATTKGEDVRAFCDAIGGVDALVVEDLEATLTPAAVLGTGFPVGMLDGMPADPATWVDVATRAIARRSFVGA